MNRKVLISIIVIFVFSVITFSEKNIEKPDIKTVFAKLEKILNYSPLKAGKEMNKLFGNPLLSDTAEIKFPEYNNEAFRAGEILKYRIKYGFITAGTIKFNVVKSDPINGREVLAIISRTETNSFFDAIYKIRDRIESYIDSKGIFTWKYANIQREGTKKINSFYQYNYKDKVINKYRSKFKKGKTESDKKQIKIDDFVIDPFSAVYFIRTQELKPGKTFSFKSHSSGSFYEIKVKVGKIEKVKVPAGKFKCFKIQPKAYENGKLQDKNSMVIWVTADKFKVPVKIKSKIAIGSIISKLTEFKL